MAALPIVNTGSHCRCCRSIQHGDAEKWDTQQIFELQETLGIPAIPATTPNSQTLNNLSQITATQQNKKQPHRTMILLSHFPAPWKLDVGLLLLLVFNQPPIRNRYTKRIQLAGRIDSSFNNKAVLARIGTCVYCFVLNEWGPLQFPPIRWNGQHLKRSRKSITSKWINQWPNQFGPWQIDSGYINKLVLVGDVTIRNGR